MPPENRISPTENIRSCNEKSPRIPTRSYREDDTIDVHLKMEACPPVKSDAGFQMVCFRGCGSVSSWKVGGWFNCRKLNYITMGKSTKLRNLNLSLKKS